MKKDSNDLTYSGSITPVVDFKHLKEVLIVLSIKENGGAEGGVDE